MVTDAELADLSSEMRAIKFMLDYAGAKEIEYERLRRAELRSGKNLQRSWLNWAAGSLGFAGEAEHDESSPRDAIDVRVSPHWPRFAHSLSDPSSDHSAASVL